jgi:hypothetical protein
MTKHDENPIELTTVAGEHGAGTLDLHPTSSYRHSPYCCCSYSTHITYYIARAIGRIEMLPITEEKEDTRSV